MTTYIDINSAPLKFRGILAICDRNKDGRIEAGSESDSARAVGQKLLCKSSLGDFLAFIDGAALHDIGVRVTEVTVNGSGGPNYAVPAMVWYPADAAEGSVPFDYHGMGKGRSRAILNATADGSSSPYPLIVASHGIGMCAPDLWRLAESWAAAGYVVVAPDHSDAAICHIDGTSDVTRRQFYRAAIKGGYDLGKTVKLLFPDQVKMVLDDISFRSNETYSTIDAAVSLNGDPGSFLRGMIAVESIGIAGHSLGGWDAFFAGGTSMRCKSVTEEMCSAPEPEIETDKLTYRTCCNSEFFGKTTNGRHENVKAVLGIGPGMIYYPNYLGLDDMAGVRTMFITEALPPMVDYETNAGRPYDTLAPEKFDVRLWANHMTVSSSIDTFPLARPILPGSLWHDRAVRTYSDWSVAFFDHSLKGDDSRIDAVMSEKNCVVRSARHED